MGLRPLQRPSDRSIDLIRAFRSRLLARFAQLSEPQARNRHNRQDSTLRVMLHRGARRKN
jgi:hypothetical protein